MFALIFMWTPPHFWALALFTRSDYDNASIPMLTVTHGRKSARKHILAYSAFGGIGLAYALPTWWPCVHCNRHHFECALSQRGFDDLAEDERQSEGDNFLAEREFFKLSLLYLFVHFSAVVVDCGLAQVGLWGVI